MIKKFPLAVTSLIVGALSFVHLFGLEKAVLAIVLGSIALREIPVEGQKSKRYAYIGIILGSLYVLTLVVFMLVKGPGIFGLIGKLR